jgi:ligand-binding sensor domain-containing protein
VIREDPKKQNVLYVGTDLGPYASTDSGKTWNYIGSGLPNAAVWDIQIHPRDNTLVIATDGRGLWVIDDPAAIQNAK